MIGFDKLNPMQKKAVLTKDGPVLVLAGAGSGKTGAITVRIASLLEDGTPPYKILAITFTNKAAKEMRARVDALAGSGARDVWILTFHSLCVRILRRDIDKLGYDRSFSIYDASDSERLMKDVFKELNYPLTGGSVSVKGTLAEINSAREELVSWEEFEQKTGGDPKRIQISAAYKRYRERLKAANALDFEDLIYRTVQLFLSSPETLAHYQNRFRYIMVDEYQDTNTSQYRLVRLLAGVHGNLCVVGDDDQSIYGWRGANIRNILEFEKDFPDTVVIKLEQNYRSTKTILDAANSVIKNNLTRKDKSLWTENPKGGIIRMHRADNEYEEGRFIADTILNETADGRGFGEFAVLYRMNAQSRILEEQFIKQNIPYRLVGGVRFYERKEIKDILAYLKAIVNSSDDISVKRIINEPKRGIGDASVDKVSAFALSRGISFYAGLKSLDEIPELKSRKRGLLDFLYLMEGLKAEAEVLPPGELIELTAERTGYFMDLKNHGEEGEYRMENIGELVSKAMQFSVDNPEAGIREFLEEVALVSDIDSLGEDEPAVALLTMHSAKGLEFPFVFIAGLEEGVFPTYRAVMYGGEKDMEEERRLCYVAITRAKERLYLTNAKMRMHNGMTMANAPSRFLEEIPPELVKRDGALEKASAADKPYSSTNKAYPKKNDFKIYKPAPQAIPKPGHTLDYAPGDSVRAPKYGIGTVKEIAPGGADYQVTVEFPGIGEKRFIASLSKLKKV